MQQKNKILVYGYGNPGRQDDALGVMLAERLEKWVAEFHIEGVNIDSNYQLNIEDAATINNYDLVIFADASLNINKNYIFSEIIPNPKVEFTMHAVSPAFVLDLCQSLYGKIPAAYLLQIKGYQWDFLEEITSDASSNLDSAFEFITKYITEYISSESAEKSKKSIIL
ncbi:MAG: hydrogenase maturation protease [Bacteroidales bacterium]|nr:hydrogenase maturation protease [Bacteroidales bacterium]